MSRNKRRTKSPPFVMLPRWVTSTSAWRHLDPPCRALYIELRERFNGRNNGMIGLGCREAAKAINVSNNTANRAFNRLTDMGFIEPTTPGSFNTNGRRATEWMLTELPDDRTGHKPSKRFASWRPEKIPSVTSKTDSPTTKTQTRSRQEKSRLRPTTKTQNGGNAGFASHQRDTSRSTTSEGLREAFGNGPDTDEAQERSGRQHTPSDAPAPAQTFQRSSDEPRQISEVLATMLTREAESG